jgi:hypothetical protein
MLAIDNGCTLVAMEPRMPADFIPLSMAMHLLRKGMWGKLPRPIPVQTAKRIFGDVSVDFAPRRACTAREFRDAVLKGELTIYLVAPEKMSGEKNSCSADLEPRALTADIVKSLLTSNGALPDHPIRPNLRTVRGDDKLLGQLKAGILAVQQSAFAHW